MEFLEKRRSNSPKRPKDVRNEFERDESRIIHSAAFRRLQSKTQVLGLGESDFYRTRLTHSMEVAQIGRGIVQYLLSEVDDEIKEFLPNSSLITTICLAHDIGHPPFGHGGEVALNYCMREYGGFEGNAQTLRILGKLGKFSRGYGLNPTRRTLLGVLKYPVKYSCLNNVEISTATPAWLFKADTCKPPKCYYDEDSDLYDFIMEYFVTDKDKFSSFERIDGKHGKSCYKSLDCSIMDLADNISYSLHDLEDALSLGMITKSDWDESFSKDHNRDIFLEYSKFVGKDRDDISKSLFESSENRKDTIGSLVNYMITNSEVFSNGSDCNHKLLHLNVKLSDHAERLRKEIFNLVKVKVIEDENVQHLEFKGQKIIIEIFQALKIDPERFLPKSTLAKFKGEPNDKAKMRVLCDFVSGMTDDYATRFYEKLFVPRKGSIFERL